MGGLGASATDDVAVDVAIVGAGVMGCSAALHLAEGGASVAVLEAVSIGFGGSGRNVGLLLGRFAEADLPLPVTEPQAAPRCRLREAYYEVGAQVAHLADARL